MSAMRTPPPARVVPKYYRLRASLLEELSSGRYRPGDRFHSRNELAERFRMSGVTVQKALDMLVSEGLLMAEQGRGTFVAALPETPRHLTVTEDGFLGLLIGDVDPTTPLSLQKCLAGIEAEAARQGYQLQVAAISGAAGQIPRMLEQGLVRGIIVQGEISGEIAERVKQFPSVQVGHSTPHGMPFVRADAVQAGYEVGRYFLRLGHRRAALVAGETTPRLVAKEIREGFRRVHAETGCPLPDELVAIDLGESEYTLAQRVLQRAPTALFVGQWLGAIGVLQAIRERGLRVPDDVSVVGYGDNVAAVHCNPPLTAVKIFTEEVARESVRTLLRIIHDPATAPRAVTHPVAIVERGSCRTIGPSLFPDRIT